MNAPMKAYDLLCSRFHIPWVWKCVRQSQTGVRWKIDGTISENHHDVSHLISVRSECVRLYLLSILNNPSVPPSHIKQLQKVKKSCFEKCFKRLVEFMHCHRAKSNQFVVFWLHFDRKVNLQIWSNDVIPQNLRRLYPLITSWNLSIAWSYLWHYRPTSIISSPGVTILHYLWQINTYFRSLTRRGARRG